MEVSSNKSVDNSAKTQASNKLPEKKDLKQQLIDGELERHEKTAKTLTIEKDKIDSVFQNQESYFRTNSDNFKNIVNIAADKKISANEEELENELKNLNTRYERELAALEERTLQEENRHNKTLEQIETGSKFSTTSQVGKA